MLSLTSDSSAWVMDKRGWQEARAFLNVMVGSGITLFENLLMLFHWVFRQNCGIPVKFIGISSQLLVCG
jgi:hypothetical protein